MRQQEFTFVADPAANAWFLNEAWVGDWLREMLVEMLTAARGGRKLRPEDLARGCEHYARYQVMLGLLAAADALPRLRLMDVVSDNLGYLPVAVDLVLDLGNARTCGILIEEHPGQGMNLSDSYPLALRDLSRAECVHGRPFDSRVEFSRASFGRDAVSRRSGRASAFAWPSPVRSGRRRCGWRARGWATRDRPGCPPPSGIFGTAAPRRRAGGSTGGRRTG